MTRPRVPHPARLPLLLAAAIWALAPASAVAQLRAADIWAEWQAGAAEADQTLTAEVTETAEGLLLENLVARSVADDVTTTAEVERVALIEQADGTLSVEVSTPSTLTIAFPAEDDDGPQGTEEVRVTLALLLTHAGLDVTVAGPPEARVYAYSAETITLVEGDIARDDGAPPPQIDLEIVALDLRTEFSLTGPADAGRFESTGTTGSLTGRIEADSPADSPEPGRIAVTFALGDLVTEAAGTRAALGAMPQAADRLPEAAEVGGTTTYAWSQLEVAARGPEGDVGASFANDGGSFGFSVSDTRLAYDVTATAPRIRMTGSGIPVPVEVAAASSALSLSLPVAAADTPSEARLRIDYREVTFGDALWSMVDPEGQLPRDPLTLILDAAAQVRLLADLTSEEAMEMARPPGELRALTVSELELSFGDAALTGTADLTFAPGQDMPRPVGEAALALRGGNALLQALEEAGVVTSEQADVARGVAGVFTRPGARPDTLETDLEFLENGTITANGLTLQ